MCRLFGQLSLEPRSAADVLAEGERSLLAQSRARSRDLQKDGWGLGWFPDGKAKLLKSPRPIFDEAEEFAEAARRARSRVVIAHVRAASNPRGLAGGPKIDLANTQPFTDGRWVFCHNGTLQIPDEVAARLGPYRRKLKSVNDSEVYFWQLRKHIDRLGSVPEALKACVRETWQLWAESRRRYPKKKSPYTGLNCLVSDGTALWALCHYPSRRGVCGLMSCQPWGVMSLAVRDKRVLVASEDMDDGSWERLGKAEVVTASISGGRIQVKRERFEPKPAGVLASSGRPAAVLGSPA